MIRPVILILTLALAASAEAAWGQTASCLDPGTVCFDANNGARYVGGHMTDPPPIHPAHPYTPADLDRLRKVEWKLLGTDAMTPWQAKMLIEARVQTDVAAGVSVDELERRAGK